MNIIDVNLRTNGELKWGNNPNKIIIHHPEWYGSVEDLNELMIGMNYTMIGYNYYVRKDGSIYKGRPVEAVGGNCYGQNTQSIGVCFEGNYENDTSMPETQFKAGVELIQYLMKKYNIEEVGPHKKYVNTACPGRYFPIDEMIAAVKGNEVTIPGPEQQNNNYSESNVGEGVYNVDSLTYEVNATIVNDFFYVRDKFGNKVPGRRVDIGDNVVVLDVSYSKQLIELIYPTPSGWIHGYIKNAPSMIKYKHQGEYHNGSTEETVYQYSNLSSKIGSLDIREAATPLYRKDGHLHIVYNTDKGENSKSGFVEYDGQFNKF